MPLIRVYLPLNPSALATLRQTGEVGPAPVAGHTALAASPRPGIGNDDEEREYAAWSAAASDAADRAADGARRVIASADVDAAVVQRPAEDSTAIELGGTIALPRIASFHIDEEPGGDVSDLLWYDVTELDDVIALLEG